MELTFGQIFFTLASLIPLSIFFSTFIVARFIWWPWKQKLISEPEVEYFYEDKYTIDKNIDSDENTNYKNLINCNLVEETPDGKVFFRYNEEEGGFEYWSDKSQKVSGRLWY